MCSVPVPTVKVTPVIQYLVCFSIICTTKRINNKSRMSQNELSITGSLIHFNVPQFMSQKWEKSPKYHLATFKFIDVIPLNKIERKGAIHLQNHQKKIYQK